MQLRGILIAGEYTVLIAVYAVVLVPVPVAMSSELFWGIDDYSAALADMLFFHAGMMALEDVEGKGKAPGCRKQVRC